MPMTLQWLKTALLFHGDEEGSLGVVRNFYREQAGAVQGIHSIGVPALKILALLNSPCLIWNTRERKHTPVRFEKYDPSIQLREEFRAGHH